MVHADLICYGTDNTYTIPWEKPRNRYKMEFGANLLRLHAVSFDELSQKVHDFLLFNSHFSLKDKIMVDLKKEVFEEQVKKRKNAQMKFDEYAKVLVPVWEEIYAYLKEISLDKAPTGNILLAYDVTNNDKLKKTMGITDDVKITKLSMAGLKKTPIYFINNKS